MAGWFFSATSVHRTRCDSEERTGGGGFPPSGGSFDASASGPPPPPQMREFESVEQKMYRKFASQPLVPIGCAATVYFLASGIKSFRDRDPVRSQRMMKYRVAAQFVTILCFAGYVAYDKGWDNLDFRFAPMYQDAKQQQQQQQQHQQQQQKQQKRGDDIS